MGFGASLKKITAEEPKLLGGAFFNTKTGLAVKKATPV